MENRDRRRLLLAVFERCTSESLISFEGELNNLPLSKLHAVSTNETAVLKRGTLWPKQDFIVLSGDQLNQSGVMRALGGTIPSAVLHIQIEQNGKLAFGAYDNFQHLHFGELLGNEFVERLLSDGILLRIHR